MGSNISIVNKTNDDLHICLSQLCPLYFENYVKPGQALSRKVGKVWFSIEAKLASDENEYSSIRTLLECCVVTAVSVCSATGGTRESSYVVGDISISSIAGRRIYSPGWYMGYHRRVEIRCKLTSTSKEANESDVDANLLMKKFYLVEVCPSGCGRESKGVCLQCS